FMDEELHELADGDRIELLARRDRFERFLRADERFRIRRIEIARRRVGPLLRAPPRVERDEPPDADVTDLMLRELRFERPALRTFLELPQERRHPPQFLAVDAFLDVDAVDPQVGQLLDDLRVGLLVATEGDAVEEDVAVDDVDPDRRPGLQMLLDRILELADLLRDHRVTGGIRAGQPAKAREPFQDGQRIERGRRRWRWRAHLAINSRAFRAARTTF